MKNVVRHILRGMYMFEAKIEFDNFYKAVYSLKNVGNTACFSNNGEDNLELRVYDSEAFKFGTAIFKNLEIKTDSEKYEFYFNFYRLIGVVESMKSICKNVKIIIENEIVFDFGKFILQLNLEYPENINKKINYKKALTWIECGYTIEKEYLHRFLKCENFSYARTIFYHAKKDLRIFRVDADNSYSLMADISKSVWKMNEDFIGETRFNTYNINSVLIPILEMPDDISMGFKKDYPLVCYFENTDLFVMIALSPVVKKDDSDEE